MLLSPLLNHTRFWSGAPVLISRGQALRCFARILDFVATYKSDLPGRKSVDRLRGSGLALRKECIFGSVELTRGSSSPSFLFREDWIARSWVFDEYKGCVPRLSLSGDLSTARKRSARFSEGSVLTELQILVTHRPGIEYGIMGTYTYGVWTLCVHCPVMRKGRDATKNVLGDTAGNMAFKRRARKVEGHWQHREIYIFEKDSYFQPSHSSM